MNLAQATAALDDLLVSWQMAVNQGPVTDPGTVEYWMSLGLSREEANDYIAAFDSVDQVASYERKQAQLDAVNWLLNRARTFDTFLHDLKLSGGKPLPKFPAEHQFDLPDAESV